MLKTSFTDTEYQEALEQFAYLETPVGEPGSGRMRYGAAMYFYLRGMIGPELLEIYRICSKLDNEAPLALAKLQDIESHSITSQS